MKTHASSAATAHKTREQSVIQQLHDEQAGQALVEYALILGVVATVAVAMLSGLGTIVQQMLAGVASAL
jgi:Flp pilus assembly pilin Flp